MSKFGLFAVFSPLAFTFVFALLALVNKFYFGDTDL